MHPHYETMKDAGEVPCLWFEHEGKRKASCPCSMKFKTAPNKTTFTCHVCGDKHRLSPKNKIKIEKKKHRNGYSVYKSYNQEFNRHVEINVNESEKTVSFDLLVVRISSKPVKLSKHSVDIKKFINYETSSLIYNKENKKLSVHSYKSNSKNSLHKWQNVTDITQIKRFIDIIYDIASNYGSKSIVAKKNLKQSLDKINEFLDRVLELNEIEQPSKGNNIDDLTYIIHDGRFKSIINMSIRNNFEFVKFITDNCDIDAICVKRYFSRHIKNNPEIAQMKNINEILKVIYPNATKKQIKTLIPFYTAKTTRDGLSKRVYLEFYQEITSLFASVVDNNSKESVLRLMLERTPYFYKRVWISGRKLDNSFTDIKKQFYKSIASAGLMNDGSKINEKIISINDGMQLIVEYISSLQSALEDGDITSEQEKRALEIISSEFTRDIKNFEKHAFKVKRKLINHDEKLFYNVIAKIEQYVFEYDDVDQLLELRTDKYEAILCPDNIEKYEIGERLSICVGMNAYTSAIINHISHIVIFDHESFPHPFVLELRINEDTDTKERKYRLVQAKTKHNKPVKSFPEVMVDLELYCKQSKIDTSRTYDMGK